MKTFAPENQIFQPITDWNDRFLKIAKNEATEEVFIAYYRDSVEAKNFRIRIPVDEKTWHERKVIKYLKTYVYNRAWAIGASRILVNCHSKLYEQIQTPFMATDGEYHHMASFMTKVYEQPFMIQWVPKEDIERMASTQVTAQQYSPKKGARIGVDLGGSDIKVVALLDGELKYYQKRNWSPKTFTDAEQHLTVVSDMISTAQRESGLKTLDGIGISTAGVVVDSRIVISGLCMGLSEKHFREKITHMGEIIKKRFAGVDVDVAHDGDVAALWAYVEMNLGNVLGLALGTGLGAGFVDKNGHITGFLCEIGKSLIDMSDRAPEHIYYHTRGPALHYLSQNAAFRLATEKDIEVNHIKEPAEKLRYIQKLAEEGNSGAIELFEMIGYYLAVAVVEFYDYFGMEHVVLFGRVTTGIAGEILFSRAKQVLENKFNDFAGKIQLHLPTTHKMNANISREFGQAIAAAYLSSIRGNLEIG